MKYYDKHGIYLYEVGDIVTIINTPLEHGKYFQTGVNGQIINWHRDMAVYCGKTATITAVDLSDGMYDIDIDGGEWCWCNAFFECVSFAVNEEDEDIKQPNINEFLSSFKVR